MMTPVIALQVYHHHFDLM